MTIHGTEKHKYYDAALGAFLVAIPAGDFGVSKESDIFFTTTLGSCVAVCIRDPVMQLGGMNHIMLPGGTESGKHAHNAALYGDYAMEVLINGIVRAGGRKERLQAKVFGGANVLSAIEGMAIGGCNTKFVSNFLDREGIPVLARDTGGTHARRIMYNPYEGRVLLNSKGVGSVDAIAKGEADHQKKILLSPRKTNIEIFR